ncbi:hypothetical protein [Neisseria animalis]|uniref:Uncharacterized protein n=1 Tax=Neisseria animalis TaxID=492 RepID=A0A5P3MVN2_NEIAN|nr:hypothetical protein [Neisseria animalis]QEY24821.1 hypothetical protein D0T90_10345 [Neisseria animalis]ROW31403.1 hypothetical protein CGZ60_10460 [Neisseria animalis]VEE07934.1 Pectate lyase superfamily protein [Neisseria animalis]
MATIQEDKVTPEWVDDLYQIEMTDPVTGGSDGVANRQAKQLGQRTQWLKKAYENAAAELVELSSKRGTLENFGLVQLVSQLTLNDESNAVTPKGVLDAISAASVSVASIAELRKYAGIEGYVAVNGYYKHKPGLGGGIFVADYLDNTSRDDGGLVIVAENGTRWKRQIEGNTLSLADFGAYPGVECGAQIQGAFDLCAGRYMLTAEAGTYLTAQELRTPTGLIFQGAGMYKTILKADAKLPAIANLITNKSNNYAVRTGYDFDIHLSHFSVDADWRGRYAIGTAINNQACGIKFSAVRLSSLTNIRSINAALHCFDICADQYLDNGDVTANAVNQSEYITVKGCVAANPYRDDAFTTHNSRHITFEDCVALFDGSVSPLGNTQQGFEADEGSSHIVFRRCLAKGYHCGYQSKGHATTKPAESITFDNCTAENCAYGGMASVGHNPTGKSGYAPQSVVFRDFIVKSPTGNSHLPNPVALLIYGADGVVVDGITVDGSANIVIEQGAGKTNLKNAVFKSKLNNSYQGAIEIRNTVTAACMVSIDNLVVSAAQEIPAIFKDSSAARLVVDTAFIANVNNNEATAIRMKRQARDRITGVWSGCKYTIDLMDEGYKLTGDVQLDAYKRIYLAGNPVVSEPFIKAPIGTVCTSQWGEEWVQRGTDGNNPNWVKTVN